MRQLHRRRTWKAADGKCDEPRSKQLFSGGRGDVVSWWKFRPTMYEPLVTEYRYWAFQNVSPTCEIVSTE
jgi:hypothetical protein